MARLKISLEWTAAAVTSVALHAVWLVQDAKAMHLPNSEPAEMTVEAEQVPPPREQAQPEPSSEENSHPAAVPPTHSTRHSMEPRAALPSAAQAGKTLTAPDSPGTSDIADFSMVQGEGAQYVGGTTSSIGTSARAVRGHASATEVKSPTASGGGQEAFSGPDRRRQATPNGSDWNCSSLFPTDPDAGDYATVLIAVTVLPSGKAKSVAVIRDPGHGFAAAARACAMMQNYSTALDREGNPIVATTPPITVRFTR